MSERERRGACPGLSTPMQTGDGLLARLTPVDDLALDAFVGFCAAARAHGNGTIEVTARGSLQARGLNADSAPPFAAAVRELGIAASDGVPVLADPLGVRDPDVIIDTAFLAAQLRQAIERAGPDLSPKVSVTLDGGGRLHLDAVGADISLRASGTAAAPRLAMAIAGDAASATPLGSLRPATAIAATVRMLELIAARGRNVRAIDVVRSDGIQAFKSTIADDLGPATPAPSRPPAEPIGYHALRDGSVAVGIALAFGQAQADALMQLAVVAAARGAHVVRPVPARALLLIGGAADKAAALSAAAARLGFITRADDPRRRVVACPGKPACASGLIAARTLAAEIAQNLSPRRDLVHVSGCAKGCAHPAAASLTVVGSDHGCGIVRHGSTQAAPSHHVAEAELVAEIGRLMSRQSEPVHG
jgi:precorrin-3B synthase